MQRITQICVNEAGSEAQQVLAEVKKGMGMIPNLISSMAHAPAAVKAYLGFSGALSAGALNHAMQEQLALAIAGFNQCDYCASAHTMLGKSKGVSDSELASSLKAQSSDVKTEALMSFAIEVMQTKGNVSDNTLENLRNVGVSDEEIIEVVAHVALNCFTNFFNHVVKTEIDFPIINTAV